MLMPKIMSAAIVLSVLLTACSGSHKGKLLPDGGPTTAELMGTTAYEQEMLYGGGEKADYLGIPLVSGYRPKNQYTHAHVAELQRDFHQIPNPQIVAYVYPHLIGNLPVPGYFTVFNLYDSIHYALGAEGYHE